MYPVIKKRSIPAIILMIQSVSLIFSQDQEWKKGILADEFIFTQAPYPSCHAATIAETPSGLIAAWFGGTYERHPDVGIWVSRHIGSSWSPPVEVANGVVSDSLSYPTWNPVLYQVPGGRLQLYYKVGPSPSAWWGMMIHSDNDGISWSEPEKLPEGFVGPVKNKPVLLDNGTLICPSSTENKGWRIHFELTDDFGKTWKMVGPVNDGEVYSAIQPTLLIHPDGMLQTLCRSRNSMILESWSADGGLTWSLLKESVLPNNNSGIDAVTLADGRHLLVYNHVKTPPGASKGYRTPLNVSVSGDGKKWYAALVLEDSEISQYSYPSVIQSSDGMVHIVYTWRRERIRYVKVDPSQLEGKEIISGQWPE
jgi:alpha-L-rhamnosidase